MQWASKLRQPFLWPALIAAAAVASLCALCFSGILWHHGVPIDTGWVATPRGDAWIIAEAESKGPARGKLQPGDQILRIDGANLNALLPDLHLIDTRRPYSIDVLRGAIPLHFVLPIAPAPQVFWTLYVYLAIALLNLGLAICIVVARPEYAPARIAFCLFAGAAATLATATLDFGFRPPLAGLSLAVYLIAGAAAWHPLEWAAVYDFGLRFPEPVPQPRVLRWARAVFYSVALVVFVLGILPVLAQVLGLSARSALFPRWVSLAWIDAWRPMVGDAFSAVALLATPIILAWNYRRLPDAIARRRLRWAALGIALAILPLACGIALRFLLQFFKQPAALDQVNSFLDNFSSFALVLAPVTLSYAIAKHRVLGIRLVIRRGVQYLLARNVLRLILYSPLIAIAIDVCLHPHEGLADFLAHKSWWFYLALIGGAAVSLRYRSHLQVWVDRKFFRSAYEEQAILSDLIERLQECDTLAEIARVVSLQIQNTLQPSNVCLLLKNEATGRFSVAYPFDSAFALQVRGLLNERLENTLQSERISRSLAEIASASDSTALLSDEVRRALLTPIMKHDGELTGLLVLGEKKSEEKYSKRDRNLLHAVAKQIALVVEMLSLRDRLKEDSRVRVEVLGRLAKEDFHLLLECPSCGSCYSGSVTHCEQDQSPLGLTLPVERVIDGKYRLDRRIGVGGMGAVYEASDLRLQRAVAVKIMIGRLFGNTAAVSRFEREARLAARLQHPAIVAIYDFGSLRGEGAYLVMQLVAGRSWRAEMQAAGAIRPARVGAWMDQLCDAIALAHASGVIHRDLKPENLLVSTDHDGAEKITVLDFGLAKLRSLPKSPEASLTTDDCVVGTQGYMSPEQRRGELVDERSDIYSLAIIVAELLTDSRPPERGASRRWLRGVLRWQISSPVCTDLADQLARCMAESPAQRPSAEELQRDLIPLLLKCPPLLASQAIGVSNTETMAKPVS